MAKTKNVKTDSKLSINPKKLTVGLKNSITTTKGKK